MRFRECALIEVDIPIGGFAYYDVLVTTFYTVLLTLPCTILYTGIKVQSGWLSWPNPKGCLYYIVTGNLTLQCTVHSYVQCTVHHT